VEKGSSETSGLGSLFESKTSHIGEKEAAFFEKWENLLTTEESDLTASKKELWCMTSRERQELGRSAIEVEQDNTDFWLK
jgi:uncharacterized protein YecA (UPF0149 family)